MDKMHKIKINGYLVTLSQEDCNKLFNELTHSGATKDISTMFWKWIFRTIWIISILIFVAWLSGRIAIVINP